MSRVGKNPVAIPDKTKVEIDGSRVSVTGPMGKLEREIHPDMTATVEGAEVLVTRPSDQKKHRSLHGLTRALINNMVEGVSRGFTRELKIIGVGYRAELRGNTLIVNVGYSHPIIMIPPDGITFEVLPKENKVFVKGVDKELVGETAAKIRSFRKPEPYKGKGIRYVDEHVTIKAGKTAGA
ncbi:MAG: 50S ribosomal protein L6 [bacterium]|nr:50S ribosomal protein L6 [bacterium]